MSIIPRVTAAMIAYYAGDVRRIGHFLTVYGYAKAIGELEGLDAPTQEILEVTALMHDIGIKASLDKYGKYTPADQEREGPPVAGAMLEELGYDAARTERVCRLIGRHHTYTGIDGPDCQILIEADFLVNFDGLSMGEDAIRKVKENIFKTKTGLAFLTDIYGI
jgi:hypothetical protein